MRETIAAAVSDALRRLDIVAPDVPVSVERPRDASHGDIATAVAMSLAKKLKRNPVEIAEAIARTVSLPADVVAGVEAVKPGFINFRLALPVLQSTVRDVLRDGDRYGSSQDGAGKKIQVEYVSANPTGPLVIVSARAAAVGQFDSQPARFRGLRNAGRVLRQRLRQAGRGAGRELSFPPEGTLRPHVVRREHRAVPVPGKLSHHARLPRWKSATRMRGWIPVMRRLPSGARRQSACSIRFAPISPRTAARFDEYFGESSLHPAASRREAAAWWRSGHTYTEDGALFFRSTDYGDDKDRVIQKSDGEPTYFLADYRVPRLQARPRFSRAIGLLGPDHHGHVPRMQAAMAALGAPADWLEIIIVGWVRLLEDGKPVSMSKRAGEFVTMRELIDDVGVDVAKYFFLMRRANSPLDFDLTLARKAVRRESGLLRAVRARTHLERGALRRRARRGIRCRRRSRVARGARGARAHAACSCISQRGCGSGGGARAAPAHHLRAGAGHGVSPVLSCMPDRGR
jgi:arginyl-tRNA synthetase